MGGIDHTEVNIEKPDRDGMEDVWGRTGDICKQFGVYMSWNSLRLDGTKNMVVMEKGDVFGQDPSGMDTKWVRIPTYITVMGSGMNRCVMEGCDRPTHNAAVPACRKHLCTRCFVGAAVATTDGDPLGQWCQACLDRTGIKGDKLGFLRSS